MSLMPAPPTSSLFPYTTLFRSPRAESVGHPAQDRPHGSRVGDRIDPANPDRAVVGSEERGEHEQQRGLDRKSTRLNSSHVRISYAVFCLKKKKKKKNTSEVDRN